MSHDGLGLSARLLSGCDATTAANFVGREVCEASLSEDKFTLTFADNTKMTLTDEWQECCECRYMTCDDDLSFLAGSTLIDVIEKESKTIDDGDDEVHEICFVEVSTSKGCITICTHNEHNGYYGGFELILREETA